MRVVPLELPDVKLIVPEVWGDSRGYFFESFHAERYAHFGISDLFVQDNQSRSQRGVLRGLHFQWPHCPQGKLVSVSEGTVWDVAVDVRRGSPTFGRWVGAELSAENHHQLWVPQGFAHGFVVLSENALFSYKCTALYSPQDEVSIRWDDPDIGIAWPERNPILSTKDASAPLLRELPEEKVPSFRAP